MNKLLGKKLEFGNIKQIEMLKRLEVEAERKEYLETAPKKKFRVNYSITCKSYIILEGVDKEHIEDIFYDEVSDSELIDELFHSDVDESEILRIEEI